MVIVAAIMLGLVMAISCARGTPSAPEPSPTQGDSEPQGIREGLTIAQVTRVIDGTTIEVNVEGRTFLIRYLGIDVPLALAQEALEFNRFLVEGRTVELETDLMEADPTGKLWRYVYVAGEMVNKTVVTNGYAVVAAFPPDFTRKTELLIAQESAKADRRGVWSPARPASREQGSPTPMPTPVVVEEFSGGTLPSLPEGGQAGICDYSGTSEAVIKGNVDPRSGEKSYHVPDGLFYATTVVDESEGDMWFCTELEALAAGWKRSKR